MLKLRLSVYICVFIFALSCHFTADAQDGSASLLYCDSEIRNFSLSTRSDSLLMSGIERPRVVDYHMRKKIFFWSDDNNIYKAPLWQEGARPSFFKRDVNSSGLAVDWIHDLIYWTDSANRAIDLSRLDGSMVRTVLKEDNISPYSIVLNPAEGFMLWSDHGKIPKIERCNMDGTRRKVIVNTSIYRVSSLTIDLESRSVFWVDYHMKYLSSAKFDGNHRKNLKAQMQIPYSLDVYGKHVYVVVRQSQQEAVYQASKVDGSGWTKVFDGTSTLRSLKVFDPSKQLEGYNVCGDNNGGCSHLCLPTSGHTFSCACPNDRSMSSDNFTCLNTDGSAVTTSTSTTNSPSSQEQTNFTSTTGSAVTTSSLTTDAPSSQLPFTVSQTNFNSITEVNKNVDTTMGSSFAFGMLVFVMASLFFIAMVGMMVYFRRFLMKTIANSGITNHVQKKNCGENMYMEAPL